MPATAASAASPEDARRKSVFTAVFLTLLLDLLGFTLILPLFPSILDHFATLKDDRLFAQFTSLSRSFRASLGIPDQSSDMSSIGSSIGTTNSSSSSTGSHHHNQRSWDSVLLGGLLGSLFSLLQFLSAPLAGGLSDVFGRRPVLAASLAGTAAAYALWAASAGSFAAFLGSRVLAGLARCSVTVATAVVSDVSSADHRARGMMWIGLAFSAAFLLGPAAGASLAQSLRANPAGNFAYPALLALGLAACALAVATARLPETLPRRAPLGEAARRAAGLLNPVKLFAFGGMGAGVRERQQMRRIALAYFLFLTLFSGLEFTLPFLAHLRLGYSRAQQGGLFVCVGLASAGLQGCLVRRLRAGSERLLAAAAIGGLIPAALLLGNAPATGGQQGSGLVFYAGLLLFSLASACPVPALTAMLSQLAPADSQGRALGVLRSLGSLARAVGPLLSSLAFWLYGPTLSYSIGGLAVVLPLAQLILMVEPLRAKTD